MWPSPRNPKAGELRDFYAEQHEQSWLSPIWASGNDIFTYFSAMSRAMALSCRGDVYVSKYNLSLCVSCSPVVCLEISRTAKFWYITKKHLIPKFSIPWVSKWAEFWIFIVSDTPYELPTKFIWGTVEYPALRYQAWWSAGGNQLITSITAFLTTFNDK